MFYSVFVLGKKGPLARVWLAAHWDKKITKAQILETNIVESVDSILQPKVKLSLRTSSHLLLGIVRIYARKTLYLLQDCQDAAFKIKSAFRPGVVDLPDGKTEAAISAITLPEMFDFINDFDLMAEPQLHLEPSTTANIRNITLAEDISSSHVDDPLLMNEMRDWSEIGSIGGGSINIRDGGDHTIMNDSGISNNNFDILDRPALDDGFGGQLGIGIVDEMNDADDVFNLTAPEEMNQNGNMENGHTDHDNAAISSRPNSRMSVASDSLSFGGPPSMAASGPPSTPGSPNLLDDVDLFNSNIDHNGNMDNHSLMNDDNLHPNAPENAISQNTMVLEPIDSQLGGLERRRKRRKKIGMVIDEVKTLSGEEMKAQLSDTSDIIANLDLAPPNKMLMNWKKTGLSDKLFSLPERTISAKVLFQYYSHNLITSRYDGSNENELNDEDALLLNQNISEEDQEMFLPNGRLNDSLHQGTLPELDDIEQHLRMSPVAPKTPRNLAPKSPAPQRKKRKTEDKENKEITKRPRESKYEKLNHLDRADSLQHNESNLLQDISSIQEARAGSDVRGSTVHGGLSMEQPHLFDESDEEREEEDDMFDYGGGPMSVGPMEEMLPDETADQFEERMRTKRSHNLLKHMGPQLEDNNHINFTTLIRNNKRKMVAQKFYALLVLKKQMAIELYQNIDMPYSEIIITKGQKYDEHMVSSVS